MNHPPAKRIFFFWLIFSWLTLNAETSLPDGYSYHRLDNGLEIMLLENPSSPMVGINVLVKRGSIHENQSSNGISHMLEHLLFNGTTTRSQKQLYDDTDLIGGYNNANTANTYTNFMFVAPHKHLHRAIEIQADMLMNSTIPEEKFEKEKGIVLEEIARALANPDEVVNRNLQWILNINSSLALPTLGTAATIKNLKREQVMDVYKEFYVPNNFLISVVGRFDRTKLLALLEETYNNVPPRPTTTNSENKSTGTVPSHDFSGVRHRFYQGEKHIVHLVCRLPMLKSTQSAHLISKYLQKIVPSTREKLAQPDRETLQSLEFQVIENLQATFLLASVKSSKPILKEDLDSLEKELSTMRFNISDEELNSIFEQDKTAFFQNLEKPHMFGIINASVLSELGADGFIQSLSFDEYLRAQSEIKGLEILPGFLTINHYPMQEHINKELSISNGKLNGSSGYYQLITKQNPMNSILAAHFLFGHKAHFESKYGSNAAWVLHDCLAQRLKMVVSKHEKRGFGFIFKLNDNPYIPMDDIYLDKDFSYVRAEALEQNISEAIPWLTSQIRNFQPTIQEYDRAVANHKRIFSQNSNSNSASELFSKSVEELVYFLPKMNTGEDLNFHRIKEFAREFFSPKNTILTIVSSQSSQDILTLFPQAEPSATSQEPPRYLKKIRDQQGEIRIHKHAEGERAYLFGGFTKSIHPSDEAALTALSVLLSEKIQFKIREELGMAYGISSGIEIIADRALFFLRLATSPKNIKTIQDLWPKFFQYENFAKLDRKTFEKSINKYLGRMAFRRLSSINQGFYLGKSLYLDHDLNHDEKLLEQLADLEPVSVQRAAEKYLQSPVPLEVIFTPEKP